MNAPCGPNALVPAPSSRLLPSECPSSDYALQLLYLEEVQFHRRFAAEEGHPHPNLALFQVDLVNAANEVYEWPVYDAHALAYDEANADSRFLGLHLPQDALDLALVQWHWPHTRSNEPCNSRCVAYDEPGPARLRIVLDQAGHFDEDVAGEDLARDSPAHAAVHLDLVNGWHYDTVDEVSRVHGLDAVLEVGFDAVFVARVGVDDVPGVTLLEVLLLGKRAFFRWLFFEV